jgi:hypothetical protein
MLLSLCLLSWEKSLSCFTFPGVCSKIAIVASQMPKYDPFTHEGHIAFDAWANSCREIESELREAGVQL